MTAFTLETAAPAVHLDIDWGSIALVFVVALVVVVAVVTLYSTGLRLLSLGTSVRDRPKPATAGGWLCLGIGGLAVLYGVYLVIPLFHT